jgi:hypothetical protein
MYRCEIVVLCPPVYDSCGVRLAIWVKIIILRVKTSVCMLTKLCSDRLVNL